MKKLAGIIIFFVMMVFSSVAYAEENPYGDTIIIPDEITGILEEIGASEEGINENFNIENIINVIKDYIVETIKRPVIMFSSIILIIIFISLINSFSDTFSDEVKRLFSFISVAVCALCIIEFIKDTISDSSQAIKTGYVFISSFIPAFAGMISMSGFVSSATVINAVVMFAAQFYSYFASNLIVPLSYYSLGISVSCSVSPELKLEHITELIKKIVIWFLGLFITLFVFLLTIQSFVAASSDSAGLKAIKFTVSNAVPFIGGTISDSLSVMKSGFHLIKNNLGVFGVIVGVVVFSKPIILALLYKLVINISSAICEAFSATAVTGLLKSAEGVISVMIALLAGLMLISVISVSLMLFLFNGGAYD